MSLSVAELITRAAEHVHASEPMFIIGATLAHIGRLKGCFKVIHADTPEEARLIRADLDKIKLPGRIASRAARSARRASSSRTAQPIDAIAVPACAGIRVCARA